MLDMILNTPVKVIRNNEAHTVSNQEIQKFPITFPHKVFN